MEKIHSIKIKVIIDTNKRTINEEYDSIEDAIAALEELQAEIG